MNNQIVTEQDAKVKFGISGIYQWTQKSTGKKYIGSAKNFIKRKDRHISALNIGNHKNKHLQNSWNKHGESDFEYKILEYTAEENLLIREQWYFDNVIDWKIDFNIANIAGRCSGTLGTKASDATKQKMSESQKRFNQTRIISDEERLQRSNAAKEMNAKRKSNGWTRSEESRKKQSEISKRLGLKPPSGNRKGCKLSEQALINVTAANRHNAEKKKNERIRQSGIVEKSNEYRIE